MDKVRIGQMSSPESSGGHGVKSLATDPNSRMLTGPNSNILPSWLTFPGVTCGGSKESRLVVKEKREDVGQGIGDSCHILWIQFQRLWGSVQEVPRSFHLQNLGNIIYHILWIDIALNGLFNFCLISFTLTFTKTAVLSKLWCSVLWTILLIYVKFTFIFYNT